MKEKIYTNLHINENENSEIEITAEIEAEKLKPFKDRAVQKFSKNMKIDGFRPGHIPEKIIVERIGTQGILEKAAEMALQKVYPTIVQEEKLQVIGKPKITITKLAENNPFSFKINTAIMPKILISDYKKIAEEEMSQKEEIKVDDNEVDKVILDIRKTRANADKKDNNKEIKDTDLSKFDDDFVKTLGDFKNVDDFKKRIRENILKEKELYNREKKRMAISEKIIEKSTIKLPKILVTAELGKMANQFKNDVANAGMEFDEYLKKINKTEEKLREGWKDTAEKRAKIQLILNEIAAKEKITPNKKEVEEQVKHMLEHYKDASSERIRVYIETLLTNEKVFAFLENPN